MPFNTSYLENQQGDPLFFGLKVDYFIVSF